MKERPNYYAILTADVRYDKELRANEKLLFAEITALSNKTGVCWANNRYFGELYGVSPRTVSTWVANLKDRGYIDVHYINKEGSKEILRREIRIGKGNVNDPLEENFHTPLEENFYTPLEENFQDNTTSINTTSNNSGEPIKLIVDYLNEKAEKQFRHGTKATKQHINARLKEGYEIEDFKRVIDVKVKDWGNDKEMNKYLRPQTLFGTKFENYVNELPKKPKKEKKMKSVKDIMGEIG